MVLTPLSDIFGSRISKQGFLSIIFDHSKRKTGIQCQTSLFDLRIGIPVIVQLIDEFLNVVVSQHKELHSLEMGDNLMLNGALQCVVGLEFDSLVGGQPAKHIILNGKVYSFCNFKGSMTFLGKTEHLKL